MLKDEANLSALAYSQAMVALAQSPDCPAWLRKSMGVAAWGRNDYEGETKDMKLLSLGWLRGVRDALLLTARELHLEGEQALAEIERDARMILDKMQRV